MRDDVGDPVVIRNAPLLDDGTPMPTRVLARRTAAVTAVSRLEAAGGVRAAEEAVDADELAAAHAPLRRRARRARCRTTPSTARPAASVARARASSACTPTTRGTSPVATTRWGGGSPSSSRRPLGIDGDHRRGERRRDRDRGRRRDAGPVGTHPRVLVAELDRHRPAVADQPDQRHRHGDRRPRRRARARSPTDELRRNRRRTRARAATRPGTWRVVERGRKRSRNRCASTATTSRTCSARSPPSRAPTALHNPALRPERVDTIVATCCAVVAIMRRLHVATATVGRLMRHPPGGRHWPRHRACTGAG